MKKRVAVLIGVLLCIGVIAWVSIGIFGKAKKTHFEIEDILPQEALLYIQLRDVEKSLKELESSPVWQGIRNINYDLLMGKNNANKQQQMLLDLVKNQLSDVLRNPLSKKLFGQEVVIVVYPPRKHANINLQKMQIVNPKFIKELLSGIFIVTRVNRDVQFTEFIARFFNQFGDNISQKQQDYKGESIHIITVSNIGVQFGVVRLKDYLVIGIGENAARKSIDVFKQDKPALAQESHFEQIRNSFIDHSNINGFLNIDALLKRFDDQKNIATASMKGLKAYGFSAQLTPIVRFDSHLISDINKLKGGMSSMYTCPSSENKTFRFIPHDIIGYHWNNCFNVEEYWKQLTFKLKQVNYPSSQISGLEERIGMNIETDIIPAFGEEIGGYIKDIQLGGLFPIPNLSVFIGIKNKSKMEQLLGKLREQPFAIFQEESYNGTSVKYFALPLGQNIQPSYCLLGDYLLLSTNRQLLKDSIDAYQNNKLSLMASPDFKEIDIGLSTKNRIIQFVRVEQMVDKVKGVVEWANQWKASEDLKAQAFKAGSKKTLEEVKESIAVKEKELADLREKIILLEDEIWNIETKGADISVKQNEFNDLKGRLDTKRDEIVSENERLVNLTDINQEYEEGSPDPELRQLYLDEVVYPILNTLKSFKSFGLRSTVSDNDFITSVLLKVKN